MPWTVSHAAAVLPLRGSTPWPLDFPALVVGSMTPDLGYYIGQFELATFEHSLRGSVLACLPTGVILLLGFYLFCKPAAFALPRPHRPALLPLCPGFGGLRPARWWIILFSLLLGIWTHIFWDSFTHESGWFAQRTALLWDPVVPVGAATFRLPFVLQLASTFIGFAIVAVAYFRWLRWQDPPETSASDTRRYLLALAISLVALLVAVPAAFHFAANLEGIMFVRAIMFRTAIYAPALALPLGLLVASIIYLRRRAG
ncbi:MAG: DUF4184 family protein [Chthoniobacterales bacterium]